MKKTFTVIALVLLAVSCNRLNHFGYSAPAKVLDEKFGFTGECVFNEVCEMLGK